MILFRMARGGILGLLAVVALAAGFPSPVHAGTIDFTGITFTCPDVSTECKGQTFALWREDPMAGYYDISLSIDTSGYKGKADGTPGDFAFGVEVKDLFESSTGKFLYSPSTLQLTRAPGDDLTKWKVDTTQLSQSCDGKDKSDTACALWIEAGTQGYKFTVGDILTWTFRIESPLGPPDSAGHIKYWYKDATGKKVAGLLSADIGIQTPPPPPPPHVPDGGSTLTLSLFGLGAVGVASRKLKTA